ncbi:MAG: putative porin [Desulfobacteraceae bacterium]|nr:putative porin [Desulfobacteraceae bacterium]
MKRLAVLSFLALGVFLIQFTIQPVLAGEVDVLIEKLVEKGILSEPEAKQLLEEIQKERVKQKDTVKEVATEAAKETAKKTAKEETKTAWSKIPKWVQRIKFKGDFRLRYQGEDKKLDNGSTYHRSRGRYRFRIGASAKVTDHFKVGFGLKTGGGNPRSANVTFTNGFESPEIRMDYAYVQYTPIKQLSLIGGQFKNPIWEPKRDLIWDGDIRPQGVAAVFKHWINPKFNVFTNSAFLILNDYKGDVKIPNMFVLQPGIGFKPSDNSWLKVAGTWYLNNNVEGNQFKYSSHTNTTNADGNLIYNYTSLAAAAEVGIDHLPGPIPVVVVFGEVIKSDADNNNVGWIAGLRFGHYVKKFGDWQLRYNYRNLERDAWLDFLPDSDFYGGKTNAKGHNARLDFGLAKNVLFGLEYYYSEKIDYSPGATSEPENLLQVDLYLKF